MKKNLLIFVFSLISSIAIAAGSGGGETKTTVSTGVKPATKYDIGKKWVSKAKKFEIKNKSKYRQMDFLRWWGKKQNSYV